MVVLELGSFLSLIAAVYVYSMHALSVGIVAHVHLRSKRLREDNRPRDAGLR